MMIFRNKEVKIITSTFIILFTIFVLCFMYMINNSISSINTIVIKQNIGAVGVIVKNHPELEEEIVKNYTADFKNNYEYGKEILNKYSYKEDLSTYKNLVFEKEYKKLYTISLAALAVFGLVFFTFIIMFLRNIFRKVRSFAESTDRIMEGSFNCELSDKEEGDFGLLSHQYNAMSERLKENMEQLKEDKLFLKRIITDISHQLKTPLASLTMYNDIMIRDVEMPFEEKYKFLQEGKNQLDRIDWLIKNLLKMAKLEGKIIEFNKEEKPIYDTIRKSIEPLELSASEKNILIKLSGDKDIRIKHDVNWTREAFSNIAKNCIEHSKLDGIVNISWESNNIFSQIVIEDNGLGISRKELPKIFERFYKGPNSSSPTNVGIGLYIAKAVVEGQEGSIYASSEEGRGTKFTITFINY
ncbi:HAMP domain-containing histidine kinase [Clostridium sp. YIM B02515]|uniref:histidine kinase n=1 Tax=Clostridium rhizosphaerae TaxID=2803861 RepID=A0ABS1TBP7_9CLOT|nr:HAMP domain-containing sensor histidine kinase [Clostridium rhizosphaerae]MBL4936522.1 HAMP domain-containing histidine kinase [Clostridium rhizosphaerae]